VKRRKPVQNENISKHASCLQKGTKVILQKYGKAIHIHAYWLRHNVMGMLVIIKDLGCFKDKK
jgi:hypothetical protein